MMRRKHTEIKILTVRQRLINALKSLRNKPVVSFETYTRIRVQIEVCNELLQMYRNRETLNATTKDDTQITN